MSTTAREEAMAKARAKRSGVKAWKDVSPGAETPASTGTLAATLAVFVESPVKPEFPDVAKFFKKVQFNGLTFKGEPMTTKKGNPMAWITFIQRDQETWKAHNGNANEVSAMVLISSKTGLPYVADFGSDNSPADTESSPLERASGSTKQKKQSGTKAFKTVFDTTFERTLYGVAKDYLRHVCSTKLGIELPEYGSFTRPTPEALDW